MYVCACTSFLFRDQRKHDLSLFCVLERYLGLVQKCLKVHVVMHSKVVAMVAVVVLELPGFIIIILISSYLPLSTATITEGHPAEPRAPKLAPQNFF